MPCDGADGRGVAGAKGGGSKARGWARSADDCNGGGERGTQCILGICKKCERDISGIKC